MNYKIVVLKVQNAQVHFIEVENSGIFLDFKGVYVNYSNIR